MSCVLQDMPWVLCYMLCALSSELSSALRSALCYALSPMAAPRPGGGSEAPVRLCRGLCGHPVSHASGWGQARGEGLACYGAPRALAWDGAQARLRGATALH